MYGVCAGTEKTGGRGAEDPTGRTTKEATGNSTIVTMLMPDPVLLESPKVSNARTNDHRYIVSDVILKESFNSSGTRAEEAAGGHAERAGEFLS